MPLPNLDAKLGIYIFTWPELNLVMRLDHLREGHDTISAEWNIYQPTPKGDIHIHAARLGLFSTTAKEALIKKLHSFSNTFDWEMLVEQAAAMAIREFRRGEPVEQIGKLALSKTSKWRLKFIVPEGETAVLFGRGESHKTTMALAFSLAVQHEWSGLGLIPEAGNVLYLDYEATRDELNERLRLMEVGMELPFTPSILYRHCSRPLVNEAEELNHIILEKQISFVVVDSAVKAAGGEKEAKENATPTLNVLRAFKTSNLVIAHHARDPERPKSPYGSVFWENDPRHILELRSPTEDTKEGNRELIILKYKSNIIRTMPILGFSISWDDLLGIRILPKKVDELITVQETVPLSKRILDMLKTGPLTQKELAEELAEKADTVKTTVWRLKQRHEVVYLSDLKAWALAAKNV